MPEENLTPDERVTAVKLLRDTIAADNYPLSPRIRRLKSALAKLDPTPTAAEPYPPAKAWATAASGSGGGDVKSVATAPLARPVLWLEQRDEEPLALGQAVDHRNRDIVASSAQHVPQCGARRQVSGAADQWNTRRRGSLRGGRRRQPTSRKR